MIKKISILSIAGILAFAGLASLAAPVYANGGNAPGNNGTLKIHEKGTPSGTESNDPKVCTFNLEGFQFDAGQDGYILFNTQGGGQSVQAGPTVAFGPTNGSGYAETIYLNDGSIDLPNGHYKATLYGKDNSGNQPNLKDKKAKSKVFKVDCEDVAPLRAQARISVTPATCETGEVLVYGKIVNATFSGTANGTEGPAKYKVVATATQGAEFGNGTDTKKFRGTLDGPLTGEQCDEPEVLVATASVSTTAATCEAGEKLIYGNIENATFTGTADGTEGPADYSVVATADKGAEFEGNQATKTFEGTLEAQLTGDDCVLGENPDPETPTTPGGQGETPEVLPNTGANTAFGLYAILAGLAGLVSAVAVAVRKNAFRGL